MKCEIIELSCGKFQVINTMGNRVEISPVFTELLDALQFANKSVAYHTAGLKPTECVTIQRGSEKYNK